MRALLLSTACLVLAASETPHPPHFAIPRFATAPSMAKDADLSTWEGALKVTDFGMIMPDDKGENRWPTTARLIWGPDALYIAFEATDPNPSQVRAALHKRDDFSGDFDFVGVDIDASGKGLSSIRLLTTPLGGQFDAIVTDSTGENYSYDCLWESVGVITDKGYVVKMRVPYSSLRRSPGDWGLRFLRIMPRERRYGIVWPRMSKDIQCDLCQMARVSGAPVDKPGSPFMVIPFATYNRTQDLSVDPSAPVEQKARLGMDLRYATTSMTLEGTYRPDFATADADVDPLQINSRFKVFYPERRPFFLEGMELLGIQGAQRQFFSRSIQAPLYGVKASGQSSFASWSVLHAKDQEGGVLLGGQGASGVDGFSSQDTAATMRFRLDDHGSGFSALGTDKRLVGGPDHSGGQSGGLYLDQYLGAEFHFIGSVLASTSHLPQSDGTLLSQRGTSTAARLDWNTRNWWASASQQTTSPDLVLLSGFTDLQGYKRRSASFGWQNNWNDGALSQASLTLRGRRLTWWSGDPLERTVGLDGWLETAGRWSFLFNWDAAGRAWADDHVRSDATRSLTLGMNWKRHSYAQMGVNWTRSRTFDLASGDPATFKGGTIFSGGILGSTSYNVTAQEGELDREADGQRLVRAREITLTATWQLPAAFYIKTQSFVVRYDGTEAEGVDKFLKAFVGWQPNAFTHAYVGWSGQRRRDPLAVIASERMVERGLFAKFAYAIQF